MVRNLVEDTLGWVFREQTVHDFGVDAHIEVIKDEGEATGKIIAAQVKCGESYFKETTETGYIFRPEKKHINYWTGFSLPVIVVLCHPESEKCFWIEVNPNNILATKKGAKVVVPFGQRFDATHKHVLRQIAGRTLAERIRQRYELRVAAAPIIMDREFFELIHRGGVLIDFHHISGIDYRALAFSADYTLYQSDSFYDLETWREILELSGVEDWEIDEAIQKAVGDES